MMPITPAVSLRSYYKQGPAQGIDYSILDRKPGSLSQTAFNTPEQQKSEAKPEGETVLIMGQVHFIPFNGEAPTLPPPAEEPQPEVFHFDVSRCLREDHGMGPVWHSNTWLLLKLDLDLAGAGICDPAAAHSPGAPGPWILGLLAPPQEPGACSPAIAHLTRI